VVTSARVGGLARPLRDGREASIACGTAQATVRVALAPSVLADGAEAAAGRDQAVCAAHDSP